VSEANKFIKKVKKNDQVSENDNCQCSGCKHYKIMLWWKSWEGTPKKERI